MDGTGQRGRSTGTTRTRISMKGEKGDRTRGTGSRYLYWRKVPPRWAVGSLFPRGPAVRAGFAKAAHHARARGRQRRLRGLFFRVVACSVVESQQFRFLGSRRKRADRAAGVRHCEPWLTGKRRGIRGGRGSSDFPACAPAVRGHGQQSHPRVHALLPVDTGKIERPRGGWPSLPRATPSGKTRTVNVYNSVSGEVSRVQLVQTRTSDGCHPLSRGNGATSSTSPSGGASTATAGATKFRDGSSPGSTNHE